MISEKNIVIEKMHYIMKYSVIEHFVVLSQLGKGWGYTAQQHLNSHVSLCSYTMRFFSLYGLQVVFLTVLL